MKLKWIIVWLIYTTQLQYSQELNLNIFRNSDSRPVVHNVEGPT